MYMDILKLKAYKLFENSDADLSWLLFKEANLYSFFFFFYIFVAIFFNLEWS